MPAEPEAALILLRHGESLLNAADRFTGLLDPPLSDRGRAEAQHAGRLLRDRNLPPTVVYTSLLDRTVETARLVLADCGSASVPLTQRWELNERNYGDLTGRRRSEVRLLFGEQSFHAWRRTVDGRPPALTDADPRHPRNLSAADPRVPPQLLTGTESLQDVIQRVSAFVSTTLTPALAAHSCVLVVAHGNSLRALCVVLDALPPAQAEALNIPTGQPLLYRWDRHADRPVVPHGSYLDLAAAHEAVAVLASHGGT